MRRVIALAVLVVFVMGSGVPAAHADATRDVALGLAAFAAFQHVLWPFYPPYREYRRREVIYQTVVTHPGVYAAPGAIIYSTAVPMVVPPPAPAPPAAPATIVPYPHGRYELRVQDQQYCWVWIPTAPPPPPLPPTR